MKVLVTGGAGFIGCNAARRFMDDGHEVLVLDSMSRRGADLNVAWLTSCGPVTVLTVDIRDFDSLNTVIGEHKDLDAIIHLAGQVAVTASVVNPREDFESNALGTFNLLEAVRLNELDPVLIEASTNKVYGALEHLEIVEEETRYRWKSLDGGVAEDMPLDFHSPYGCSKGAADQYVRDYHRIYGVRSVVFRQSCIYGPRQFGIEDQGWVAWFTIATMLDRPITICGTGKQVRDVLFVEDLIDAFVLAIEKIDTAAGRIYNIGGGPSNTISLLELLDLLETICGRRARLSFTEARPGDQPVFVCNIGRVQKDLGWRPRIGVEEGVRQLAAWVDANKGLFK
jgi:CDP-paratose 2-epimerase